MKPKHLSDLRDYRKRQEMTELLRREVLAKRRVRVKAVGRHVPKEAR
jgi:hypothetical protein